MKITGLTLEKDDTLTIKFDSWLASLRVSATEEEITIEACDVRYYGDQRVVLKLPNRTKTET